MTAKERKYRAKLILSGKAVIAFVYDKCCD